MAEVELPDLEELSAASDRFSKRVALMTAVYAVTLAVASLGGGNAMKEMLLAQQEASNQWAFYQAKAIREHQYRVQKLVLEADLEERRDTMKPQSRRKLEAALQRFTEEEKRYAEDKKDIEKAARKHEAERDLNQAKDPYFDYAEVLLQIAIVMGAGLHPLEVPAAVLHEPGPRPRRRRPGLQRLHPALSPPPPARGPLSAGGASLRPLGPEGHRFSLPDCRPAERPPL